MSWEKHRKVQNFFPSNREVIEIDKDGNERVDNLIKYKCLSCNKDYLDKIDEELKN